MEKYAQNAMKNVENVQVQEKKIAQHAKIQINFTKKNAIKNAPLIHFYRKTTAKIAMKPAMPAMDLNQTIASHALKKAFGSIIHA